MESGGAAMAFLFWNKKSLPFCGKSNVKTGLFERKIREK